MKILALTILLMSMPTKGPEPVKECVVSGCSGQLCVEGSQTDGGGVATTCEWREEYACYKSYGKCGLIDPGKTTQRCGWEKSAELKQCLSGKRLPLLDEKTGTTK